MSEIIDVPVLLIIFNRPDTTQIVFNAIRNSKPTKLYVFADGPRSGNTNDIVNCKKVREIVKNVDWQCECFYSFNKKNLGAEVSVSSAVSWALEKEEFVIVLEDDIVAPKSFFIFMQEMLLKYRNESQIAMVSGSNFTPIDLPNHEDYLFGVYGHTWGWATWKRAWEKFDLYTNDFNEKLNPDFLKSISNNRSERVFNRKLFSTMKQNGSGLNNWDYCWFYKRISNGLLSVIPRTNLTSNIGVYGLHANGKTEHHFRKFDEKFKATIHPSIVQRNVDYDKHHFKNYLNKKPALYLRILNKCESVIKRLLN